MQQLAKEVFVESEHRKEIIEKESVKNFQRIENQLRDLKKVLDTWDKQCNQLSKKQKIPYLYLLSKQNENEE